MGKIFYIMGKSSSGKDTIYKKLREELPQLQTVTLYTTRPIREGEADGEAYYFVDEEKMLELEGAGKVIELRAYDTVHGIWKYATVDDGQFDLAEQNYLMIGTLESYEKLRNYFGMEALVPIYIEVEDGERLRRAIAREEQEQEPKYAELCRRFLADTKDFAEENLKRLGIAKRFQNQDAGQCFREILERIKKEIRNFC